MSSSDYTILLYFAELEKTNADTRRFDVEIQGGPVLSNFNISENAGGLNRLYVKKVEGVQVANKLNIKLNPADENMPALISGIEVIANDIKLGANK